jgi:hypothetical protein
MEPVHSSKTSIHLSQTIRHYKTVHFTVTAMKTSDSEVTVDVCLHSCLANDDVQWVSNYIQANSIGVTWSRTVHVGEILFQGTLTRIQQHFSMIFIMSHKHQPPWCSNTSRKCQLHSLLQSKSLDGVPIWVSHSTQNRYGHSGNQHWSLITEMHIWAHSDQAIIFPCN